ncbi:hypothetical protein BT67DRAFT_369599 [Trichocladium antarcticum]|uniref:Uncharacterized protein n=1 Tax=Trichocladium antarcticum TaxID=1450529 RepID=A0AAN6UTV2_9PEZI|nr:hypothetical protein BT67DRAFT_369599 [Trichocladium antarcticum]
MGVGDCLSRILCACIHVVLTRFPYKESWTAEQLANVILRNVTLALMIRLGTKSKLSTTYYP